VVPADEVDEVRLVAGWVAEHEPPELALEPPPADRTLLSFAESRAAAA
jgi:hypothetical protein